MCVGLILTGLAMSLLIVPVIPELMSSTKEALNLHDESPELCNKATAMFLTAQSLGYIFGPIVGGSLYDGFGFRGTTDILMMVAVWFSVLYYILNIRPLRKRESLDDDSVQTSIE